MNKPEDLTSQEEKNLSDQLRIASREAEIRESMVTMPGAPAGLTEEFMKNIMDFEDRLNVQTESVVGNYLKGHNFPDADTLTEETAGNAIDDLLQRLADNSIYLHGPEMVSAKEFYRWLTEDFVRQEINMPVGGGWNTNFIYSELVPEGLDAMNFMVSTCIDDLFNVEHALNPWTFEDSLTARDKGDFSSRLIPPLQRYVDAWRDAVRSVVEYKYTPLNGVRLESNLAEFTFRLSYTVGREDGREETFAGKGTAKLVYDGLHWNVRSLSFPGFKL